MSVTISRYAVKCDECKTDMRRTDSLRESAAGGLCEGCRMVARRVSRGYNEWESRELLARLVREHAGDNLDHALVYYAFCTVLNGRAA